MVRATATAGASLAFAIGLLQPTPSSSAQVKQPPPAPSPAWEIEFDDSRPRQIVAGDSTVYASDASVLQALAIDDGRARWSRPLGPGATLVPGGDRLFVITDGRIDALDAATGEPHWSTVMSAGAGPVLAGWARGLLVTAVGTGVYFLGEEDGALHASAGLEAPLELAPIVTDSMVLVAPAADRVIGLDRTSGRRLWLARLESKATAVSSYADRVYVSGTNGGLYCFRPPAPRYQWRFSLYTRASGPATADATSVYVALFDNTVQAIGRTSGTRRWSHTISGRPATSAWPAGDRLFLAQADGGVTVLRAATGARLAQLTPQGETRQLEAAGLVPGSPPAFFTLTRGTSGVERLTLWRPEP